MKPKFKTKHIIVLILFLLVGYVLTNMFRTKRLTEKEKAFIPYEKNDEIIFESNKSEIDTINITDLTLSEHPPNLGDMFWAKNTEALRVQTNNHCKTCDGLVSLRTENFSFDTNVSWSIRINCKNYVFGTNLASINKLKSTKLVVNGIEYVDVLVLERGERFIRPKDKFSKMFYNGIFPIDRLYWSKSNGIMKFEIIETNEIWTIKNAVHHRK
ncbi:hypothetical protein HNV10_13400 [Winogradskyella litoriviva]|uniref:Uncharacterized protein n=1 Tax=Winogradskyella litoriviva TaxID=1220182 RepID=A0ABX2E7I0_9FLAO|nr:hypothetical protein [Winogradskyella litoriviva]NRD24249.1 hypothetical protein [Winogradskyella litoriviva]